MIKFSQVSKSYEIPGEDGGVGRSKIDIIRNLNWSLEDGDSCAIIGPSGSGKSTLLALAAGLDSPDQGEIELFSQNLKTLRGDKLIEFRAKNIGIVYQGHFLISSLTALENVMLPPVIQGLTHAKEKALHILDEVGLSHRLNHYPSQLSGGECQRVAMARALVHGPRMILADEPSGSLDVETGKKVMGLFFKLIEQKKMTAILVTHDLNLARLTKHPFELISGQLQRTQL